MTAVMNHEDFVIDIKTKLESAESPETKDCCIYRVPLDIRTHTEDVYTPKVVSIGPFHHGCHAHLQNMERLKLFYCKSFLARGEATFHSWTRYIEEVEPNIRRCYSHTLQFNKEQLVNLILVDSGFILELFWRHYYPHSSGDDTFVLKPWLDTKIRLDLLLLENQLPFFVLDTLFNMSFSSKFVIDTLFNMSFSSTSAGANNRTPSFIELTFKYFAYFNRSSLDFERISICHFTDLLRTFHLQHPPRDMTDELRTHVPNVTELAEAGMMFKVNTKSKCLLDLEFSGKVLEIPKLEVSAWTALLFCNMLALEQLHYPHLAYITDYLCLMGYLVNSRKDVDILIENEVLVNFLHTSDSAAQLFPGLFKNIVLVNSSTDYLILSEQLNGFGRNPCRILKTTLKRDYFKTPWQTAASLAGIVLLFLSLLQSVCAIFQVIYSK